MVDISQIFGPITDWIAGRFSTKYDPFLEERKKLVNGGFEEVVQLVAWDNGRDQLIGFDWIGRVDANSSCLNSDANYY